MARPRDAQEVASLQHRALLYACADQRRAAAMLLAAAKNVLGHDTFRSVLWSAMRERLTPEKPEGD
jgi:hypothetical protein